MARVRLTCGGGRGRDSATALQSRRTLTRKKAAGMDGAVAGIMPAATAGSISAVTSIIFACIEGSPGIHSTVRGSVAGRAHADRSMMRGRHGQHGWPARFTTGPGGARPAFGARPADRLSVVRRSQSASPPPPGTAGRPRRRVARPVLLVPGVDDVFWPTAYDAAFWDSGTAGVPRQDSPSCLRRTLPICRAPARPAS